ncbi:MAG: enoyl-CoA hydratase/isomerase family protein [Chloroflexi bacterium]|nr:enoyl-CoA hydratase/isomerase family protein [Chloroflexota bacterium]
MVVETPKTTFETITYEKTGHILSVTLNRPERLNALNGKMMVELAEAWRLYKNDDDAWVAIVTGNGRAFCAGGDVKEFASRQAQGISAVARETFPKGFKGWAPKRYEVYKPLIAAVHGVVTGGGLDLVTDADIAIGTPDTVFFDSHVSIGWVSGHEAVQLAHRIPLGEALMLEALGNEYRLRADRAYQIGLLQELVPPEKLLTRAMELANQILTNAPKAVEGTLQGMWQSLGHPREVGIAMSEGVLRENTMREDHREGPRAFAERRKPAWKGK